jgi:hypothetical protein
MSDSANQIQVSDGDGGVKWLHVEMDTMSNMTRRDWLAGMAMQGIMSTEGSLKALPKGNPARIIANMSYQFADAMIKQGEE